LSNKNNLHSIAILTCFYGKWPWYFPYFIHSCKYNPSVDFIIITDNIVADNILPENVIIFQKRMDEICAVASEKMGFKVAIENPYKLCDYKPTHAFLFPEIVKGYNFWGHGDIDVLYGDIRAFITEEILNSYDIINSRHDYITGAFCLYKNNKQMNTLFMQSKDYRTVFINPEHYCFDECNFLYKELRDGSSIFDHPGNIQSMTYVVKRAVAEGELRALFDFIILEGVPGKIKWDNGKIIYKNEFEAMFYHLIKFKTTCKNTVALNPIPETLYLTTKQIHTNKDI